jgi:subtilisin family serine protease
VTVGVASGNWVTAMIPVNRFAELAESGICSSINMGGKQHLMLDNVRPNLGIDMIHAGMNLPQGYDGSGVVVGILDDGFQYCHPAFYDATGTTLRVKRVWNQKDSTGTGTAGYGYGSEYTTESQMMAAQTDDMGQSHGSHVASTAAGCGAPYGDGATYKGIAPGADLVFVPLIFNLSNIIDAINYVHFPCPHTRTP